MRAIPQSHNGIRYRSRTEARWAEFWALAEIPFEYEPEGFDLDGEWYVPDFRVGGLYFEVKGVEPNDRERRVAEKLAAITKAPVVIADGNPGASKLICFGIGDQPGGCVIVEEFRGDGAWLAEFVDGGGWAVPLRDGLVNCAATGQEHPMLAEAGRLQFRQPKSDAGFAQIGDLVQTLVHRLMKNRSATP